MEYKIINKDNFEQSIEFIYPTIPNKIKKYPLIIYIGGTGWLGYIPIIYRIADYWNRRIINNLVREGYSCGIIRYRGKFIKSLNYKLIIIILYFLFIFNINYFIICSILFIYWKRCEYYSPSILEMENDVIKNIKNCLLYNNSIKKQLNTDSKILFITYSAGSQILLSSLQKIHNEIEENIIKGIIIVSGVLKIPEEFDLSDKYINKLARLVLNIIFKEKLDKLFCPSRDFINNKELPFLIIKSRNEFLNIPIIESIGKKFFYSDDFIKKIKFKNIYYVNSNHWLILTNKNVIEYIKNFINK